MANITDRESFEAWLEGKPREVAVVIAARSALRVLPLLGIAFQSEPKGWTQERLRKDLVLTTFRALAAAHLASLAPGRAARVAAKAAARAARAAARAADAAADAAAYAAARAADAAADAAAYAADAAARAAAYAVADPLSIWLSIQQDCDAADAGKSPAEIVALPLWPDRTPDWAAARWRNLKRHLLEQGDENWLVWTDWYDARLAGGPIDIALETGRVLSLSNDDWNKGPAHANALLAGIMARRRGAQPVDAVKSSHRSSKTQLLATIRQVEKPAFAISYEVRGHYVAPKFTGDQTDRDACANPLVVQRFDPLKRRAIAFRVTAQRVSNFAGWEALPRSAQKFAAGIDRPLVEIPDIIGLLYDDCVDLATFLEQSNKRQAGPLKGVEEIDHDIHRELEALVRVAAPWVRMFPSAQKIDEAAGNFLGNPDLFGVAKIVFAEIENVQILEEEDRALMRDFLAAVERGDFQSEKVRNRFSGSIKSLTQTIFAFYLGMVGNQAAVGSVLANKGAALVNAAENQIIQLYQDQAPEIIRAIREIMDRMKDTPLVPNGGKPISLVIRRPDNEKDDEE